MKTLEITTNDVFLLKINCTYKDGKIVQKGDLFLKFEEVGYKDVAHNQKVKMLIQIGKGQICFESDRNLNTTEKKVQRVKQ